MKAAPFFWPVSAVLVLASCTPKAPATRPPQISAQEILSEEIAPTAQEKKPPRVKAKAAGVPTVENHPALRDLVTITAFNLPLANVLQSLIEPTKLNLEIKENVDLSKTVSVKATGLSLGRVLQTALSPIGYSFRVSDDTLVVFETDTRTFRLSIPGLTQNYQAKITNQSTTDISRDAIGTAAVTTDALTTGQRIGGTTLGSEVTVRTYTEQADIWKIIDENLKSMVTPPGRYSLDRISGNISVTAKAPVLDNVARYVDYLEQEYSRQARFDVKIVEVTVEDNTQFGVDWKKIFNSLIAYNTVEIATNTALTQNLDSPLPSFTLTSPSGASNIVISALKEQGNVKLISQPKIMVRNNMVAVISIGEVIPFISNVSTIITDAATTTSPTLSSVQTGVVLSITAKINGDKTMTIHLTPILSRVTSFEEFTVGTTSFRAPVLDTRNFSTLINAKNAETVVLGGLITQGEEKERRSIPFFGDIPFLGELAGSRIKKDERSELVVILTPTIETLAP